MKFIVRVWLIVVVMLCGLFSLSPPLMAQSHSHSELRLLVWTAAKEIESGNLDRAREMLREVGKNDDIPADLQALVEQLATNVQSEANRNESAEKGADLSNAIAVDMSAEELQQYLDGLSAAAQRLFSEVP